MKNNTDRVILREYKAPWGTGIEAVLPDEEANFGHIVFYEHVGQHSEGTLDYYRTTAPADPDTPEAKALVAELESIGYNVRLVKRLTRPFGGWAM